MDSTELLLPQSFDPRDGYSTPGWDLPMAPPSTEASSPYQRIARSSPQPQDLMYVTERLWSRSQKHTRRFSFENPTWPDDEEYLFGASSSRFSAQDDDATIVSNSVRTQSRCSQTTLCGSLNPNDSDSVAAAPSLKPSECLQLQALPPAPDSGCLSFSPTYEHVASQPSQGCLRGSPISGSACMRQVSYPLGYVSHVHPSPTHDDRVYPWPTFVAQRAAPKPPVIEEKSAWDDSDSEGETERTQSSRFKRRFSNPLRAFLCKGKEPRRRSA